MLVAQAGTGTEEEVLHRINVGGPEFASADGSLPVWSSDTNSSPSPFRTAGSSTVYDDSFPEAYPGPVVISPLLPLAAGVPSSFFQTERWDKGALPEMTWSFPV